MEEDIYNLFVYVSDNMINKIGLCVHRVSGSDQEKILYLRDRVEADCQKPISHAVPELSYPEFLAKYRLGTHLSIFEPLFLANKAPADPLCCLTPIVDGRPRFDIQSDLKVFDIDAFQNTEYFPGAMPDYLQKYLKDDQFDFSSLINDDFLLAIKLLWNNRNYVSAAKLLMSMIDTIAYIEFDDVPGNFQKWLDQYANLSGLGITAKELWEFRNSLLHMTNLYSRKVKQGGTPSLVMYVGDAAQLVPPNTSRTKYFNLKRLIDEINQALARWLMTYGDQPAKFEAFVERYDLIVSDSRMATFVVTSDNTTEQ
ncbi:hypothetical protein [Kordiimonas sp.]|uniref:hypothetical protein n=1 Tax=Kordiimonas sp. TaxID=1970157 RepID=UPI003A91D513